MWKHPDFGTFAALAAFAALVLAAPAAQARDSLGMFATWGAFRDAAVPRCYAIAMANPSTLRRDFQPYASIGTWPGQGLRNQLHLRLSRRLAAGSAVTLTLDGQRFTLIAEGVDAWAADRRMDAAITAAMRSASSMTASARGADGKGFSNTWPLDGAASAMDAATLGCARER